MRALIIMAHGSRRKAANAEFVSCVNQVAAMVSGLYERVGHAYLDSVAEPSLETVALSYIEAGVKKIDVYPFFLNRGQHAYKDIPARVAALNREHPGCKIKLLAHLGRSDELVALAVRHIVSQRAGR